MTSQPIQPRAFVIGPIGDKHAADGSDERIAYENGVQVFEEVIIPSCAAFGLEAFRSDDIQRTGEIPEQVFRFLRDSPIVIADLTNANANVMYELGLRHTTGKLTIQIGEKNRLPFDVAAIRTLMFIRSPGGLVEARRHLSRILAVSLHEGGDPVSATRVWFENVTTADLPIASEANEEDEPGFMEKLADTEAGIQSLTQALSAGTVITGEISRIVNEGTAEISRSDEAGGSASQRLAIINRVAAKLAEPTTRLEVIGGDYLQSVNRMEPGLRYLLNQAADDPTYLDKAPDFLANLQTIIAAAKSSVEQNLGFQSSLRKTGEASRSLRQVSRRLIGALDLMISASRRLADLADADS